VDFDSVFAIATLIGLSACAAGYLSLARRLGAPLITLDKRLAAAAEKF